METFINAVTRFAPLVRVSCSKFLVLLLVAHGFETDM